MADGALRYHKSPIAAARSPQSGQPSIGITGWPLNVLEEGISNGAQSPIDASVVGRDSIVIGGQARFDWLVAYLEDAAHATADGQMICE
jgi:hypothetical protein